MALTNDDFKKGQLLYRGVAVEDIHFNGNQIFKLDSGEFFIRKDFSLLGLNGFNPEVEIFDIQGNIVLIFLKNGNYTYVESIKVIESKTVDGFNNFFPGQTFNLQNGQVWQQVDGPNSNCSSSGYVKIVNDSQIKVDSWDFYPNVKLIKG